MRIDVFTLFPAMFAGPLETSIIGRARQRGLVQIELHNIRDYAPGKHHVTDSPPYGGGGGMIMRVEPLVNAVEAVLGPVRGATPVVFLTPQGRPFTQADARAFSQQERLALVCGRYEGVDERARLLLATDEISIGDYVLSGGELAALVIIDAVTRLIPGALGARWAPLEDSHGETGLLEGPHYTRPEEFRGHRAPAVLLSGHHQRIAAWRRRQSLLRTWERRPDLLARAQLTDEEREFLDHLEGQTPLPE